LRAQAPGSVQRHRIEIRQQINVGAAGLKGLYAIALRVKTAINHHKVSRP
jgi:hypothetical protein